MSYTPAADLQFSAAAYTPDPAIDFSEPAADVSCDQGWAVVAYQIADATFDATWAIDGDVPDEVSTDFAWSLDAPDTGDVVADAAWGLSAADSSGDLQPDQSWALDSFSFFDLDSDSLWAIDVLAISDGVSNQRWEVDVVAWADSVATDQWSIVVPTMAECSANLHWRISAYAMADRPGNGRWALTAPTYGDRPVGQQWAQPGATIRDCVVWHGWTLNAPLYQGRIANQLWAVPAAGFGNYPADQRWTLAAYSAGDRAFSGSWRIATMGFGDRPADALWTVDVPEHIVQAATPWAWSILTVTVRDLILGFRYAQTGAVAGLIDFDAAWAVDIPAWGEFDGSWSYLAVAPEWDDFPGDHLWVLDAPMGGDIVQWQLWAQRGAAVWTPVVTATTYTLTLTGSADGVDDIVLPMRSFSTRLSRDGSSYLQVSVPNGRRYAADIAARSRGDLVISRGDRYTDDRLDVAEIARATVSQVMPSYGGRASSVSVQGRRDPIETTPRSVAVSGVSTWSISGGKNRWRTRINNDLRPGDTAVVDGRSAVIGEIVHTVNASDAYMDIAEA